ncbi:5-oxoprolinase subunit PxpB [Paraglaciecola sp.]|uniref:5-oxoprolinase subunit PxpB n=1 Tax=Paraglaciecola sp. TaxID=1920173 RepID=UPI0030F3EFE8
MSLLSTKLVANGDSGLTVLFDAPVSEQLSRQIQWLSKQCQQQFAEFLLDTIPAYQSLTLLYRPRANTYQMLHEALQNMLLKPIAQDDYQAKNISIPVCYQGEYAPDLQAMAKTCGLSTQEVVALHFAPEYLVHILGFSPGFLYLGGLAQALICPRKSIPATSVPAGSVGIGGEQTGIYPQASPGGWHIIGRTPLKLFTPHSASPCIAQPLDKIVFEPISPQDFVRLSEKK